MAEEQSTKRLPPKITNLKVERSIIWKIYFILLVCLTALGAGFIFSEENFGIIEIIDIPMTLISTIGLYGYVFSKRIHKQSFWFSFFWVYLVFSFVNPFLSEIGFLADDPELSDAENKFVTEGLDKLGTPLRTVQMMTVRAVYEIGFSSKVEAGQVFLELCNEGEL